MYIPKQVVLKIPLRPILITFVVAVVAVTGWLLVSRIHLARANTEIAQIKATTDLKVQTELYKKLMIREGAVQAQEDLYHSGLPFTGQTHLLNHEAGEWLYETYGAAGLSQCKEYFLASCYHGFVLDAIGDGGMPKVAEVMDACRKNGPAVFAQCTHAVGHGFLAFKDYKDLVGALKLCDEMQKTITDMPSFSCYDGVFMENIWGVHDDGKPSPYRWVKDNDPLYPCDDKRIDPKYLLGCWSNQPSLMFQQSRGDLAKVGQECLAVKQTDLQKMCFNGLSRQINPLTDGSAAKVFQLCNFLPTPWNNYCVTINANAYYSVGDRVVPFEICNQATEPTRTDCYNNLAGIIKYSSKTPAEAQSLCKKIEDPTWQSRCLSQ